MTDKRLSQEAYEAILLLIGTGAFPAGTKLGEAKLGERFGMSRTPVREAIGRLESERLALRQGRLLVVHGPTIEEVREVFFVLKQLEPRCAGAAAVTRTRSAGVLLKQLSETPLDDAGTLEAFYHLRQAVLSLLTLACTNSEMVNMLKLMRNRLLVLTPLCRLDEILGAYQVMLSAIASGDTNAAEEACLQAIQTEEALLLQALDKPEV